MHGRHRRQTAAGAKILHFDAMKQHLELGAEDEIAKKQQRWRGEKSRSSTRVGERGRRRRRVRPRNKAASAMSAGMNIT